MTRANKADAQRILEALRKEGVSVSVDQVAKEFDDARDWRRGAISLAALCDRTGWGMPDPTQVKESLHTASLPTGVLRHIREVLAADGTDASREALELLPAAEAK
ncbi:hypothetical protein ACFZAM_31825 [Streptomyces sp. NPDC008079]|uniref:hypothetical protein n=1 Tax=Streptomyces sp. NPDC008079 TaxID=3364806 RepID=UPI0036E2AA08